jgi:PIN domain
LASETKTVTERKRLVLDANILLRAVFGVRVRALLETYEDSVTFYTPDICFSDALKYIPIITATRQLDPGPGLLVLNQLARLIEIVDQSLYEEHEAFCAGENAIPGRQGLADRGNLVAARLPRLDRRPGLLW